MEDKIADTLFVIFIIFVIILVSLTVVISCNQRAEIYNQKFGTKYTASDFFFAGETIDNLNKDIRIGD